MIFFQRLSILLVYISATFTIDLFVRSTSQHLNNSSYFRPAFRQFTASFLVDQVGFREIGIINRCRFAAVPARLIQGQW